VCIPGVAMASSDSGLLRPAHGNETALVAEIDDLVDRQAAVSAALASVFRGKLCDLIRPNRKTTTFNKHQVIYDMGDGERTLFFLQNGVVKVGTIGASGREVIYDVRKGGDVVGELSASEQVRFDRAVALEQTDALAVPFQEVMELLLKKPDLIAVLVDVGLATKLGRRSGSLVEIPTYFTQEEIAQMAAARRERISTALNSLRRQGLVQYSMRGNLVLNVSALESYLG